MPFRRRARQIANCTWPPLLVVALASSCAGQPPEWQALDDAPAVVLDTEEAKRVVETMIEERRRLQSGVFRGRGTVSYRNPADELQAAALSGSEVESFGAFDWNRRWRRFDNREQSTVTFERRTPVNPATPDGPTERSSETGIFTHERKAASTPEGVVHWNGYLESVNIRNNVVIARPDKHFSLGPFHHPFDPRALGLLYLPWFSEGYVLDQAVEMHRSAPVDGRRSRDEVVIVHWRNPIGADRFLQIDTGHGHTAIRFEQYEDRYIEAGRSSPSHKNEVGWRLENEVWVPEWFSIELHSPIAGRSVRYEYELEWEAVNTPVDEGLFSYTSFGELPQGTFVVDHRADPDKPKIIDAVGGEIPILVDDPPPADIAPARVNSEWRRWLLIINLSVIISIGVAFAVQRRLRR